MWLVLAWLLWQRAPVWWSSFQLEDQRAPSFSAVDLQGVSAELPISAGRPVALIFWATWCGPCKIELSRFQKAIDENEIPAQSILAVSVGEATQTVKAFVQERKYTFPVYVDPTEVSRGLYNVKVTPTVVLLDQSGKIDWAGTGISPLAIQRLKSLLKGP